MQPYMLHRCLRCGTEPQNYTMAASATAQMLTSGLLAAFSQVRPQIHLMMTEVGVHAGFSFFGSRRHGLPAQADIALEMAVRINP